MNEYWISLWLLCVVKVFGCDVGQFQTGDSCYELVKPERIITWLDAAQFCNDARGTLVSFETYSEQSAVRDKAIIDYNTDDKYYIGLYNQGIGPMWLSGGDLSFTNWSAASAPEGDSCAGTVLDVKNNNWLRVVCEIRYEQIGYICEYPYYEGSTAEPKEIFTITPIQLKTVGVTQKTNDLIELCPPERFIYGNSCYEFVEDPVTTNWSYAVNQCSAKGGQLVSLETEDEHTAIVQGLTERYLTYKQLFIGLMYPSDGEDAEWLSGAPLTYDRYGENDSNFKCTSIFAFHSVWYGSPCDPDIPTVDGYICEYPREIVMPATNTVLMASGSAEPTDVTNMLRDEMNEDNSNWKAGVLTAAIVLLIFVIVGIVFLCRRKSADKPHNNSNVEISNEAIADVSERVTQTDVVPVYMQLETPDIIRETPNNVESMSGLEINTQPNYEAVDEGGNYYEIRQVDPKENDTVVKNKFISRNISRAKTVFRMNGRKSFTDQNQGKKDIKSNRPKSCKTHYLAEHEGALYAHSSLGFSRNTCSLPNHGSSSVADENFYHKPIYDICEGTPEDEGIYSLPCADTLASKSNNESLKQVNTTETVNFETDHYYSSVTDPTNDQPETPTASDGVYFVLEKSEGVVNSDDDCELGREVENEIYEAGSN